MTADYDAAVQKHRFDLLYAGGTLAALIETIRETDHLLVGERGGVAGLPRIGFRPPADGPCRDAGEAAGYAEIRLYTNQRFAETSRSTASSATAWTARRCSRSGTVTHMSKKL